MMEKELEILLAERGWNLLVRTKPGKRGGSRFYVAQKWMKKQVYIASQKKLATIKPEEVIEKLAAAE
jgi:hypothetical protein